MDDQGQANLDGILRKVRGLIAKAEHETTPKHEALLAQKMADALMLKYSVDSAMADAAKPADERMKPMIMTVEIGAESDIRGYIATMCGDIARHCRCRVRLYSNWKDGAWQARVYGFESDVRYFDLLYTTVRLQMIRALIPRFETEKTLDENCYRLHAAGYNWLEIASIDGWHKDAGSQYRGEYNGTRPPEGLATPYWHKEHGWRSASQVGSHYKRACQREERRRGEANRTIPANGSTHYRKSSAAGYITRINQRLRAAAGASNAGSELLLRSRIDDLDALFRQDNPDLFPEKKEEEKSNTKARKRALPRYKPVNMDAYQQGTKAADAADLNTSARMGGGAREIG